MTVSDFIESVSKEQHLSKEQKDKLADAFSRVSEGAATPKEALGLTDQTIEAIYGHAYRLYQSAKYKDAGYVFHMLRALNPEDPRFYLGMGACLHRLGKYELATFMYQVAGQLDRDNPMPLYYCSDCSIKLGHFNRAIFLLQEVVRRCGTKSNYISIRDRSLMTISSLEQQLTEVKQP